MLEPTVNSRLSLYLAAFALTSTMIACFEENSTSETIMVQPGTTTRPLGPLYFQNPAGAHSNTTGEPIPFTACKMAQNAGSIALVEFEADGEPVPREDCTGPYSGDAFIIPSQVYGVAAGEALPSHIDLVVNAGIGPRGLGRKGGTIWLVTVRQSDGQWFITNALAVALDEGGSIATSPPTTDHELNTDFPPNFYDLSDIMTARVSDLSTYCVVEAGARMDDPTFREYYYNPRSRAGSNCHPEDGPQQQNSSEIDEEDLPPNGGTDDSIQP